MITPQEALQRTIEHREIFHDEMLHLMRQIMQGEISPLMVAAILTGLRVKKETIGEISAAAMVMRELSTSSRALSRVLDGLESNPQMLLFGRGAAVPGPGETGYSAPTNKGVQR